MSYCMYLRKSRADRDNPLWSETEILARHEEALKELAFNMGCIVTKIYKEVVSGETLAARPQMQQLLTEVESGKWEGVFVMEIERLARGNSIDQGIVSQAFKYSNTLIITPSKIYNPANEFDEEYFEFGLFMSRREYKTINRRLNAGRIASCREGKYVGSIAPYGYERVKLEGQKGYTLKPEPQESEVVKLIFKLYTQENRIGTRRICQKLDAMGIGTRKGGKWSLPTVRDILKNDVYIGKIHWNKAKTVKTAVDGGIALSRPRQKNFDVFDGIHQPLIDIDTFNLAQYYMSKNPPNPAKGTVANPLSGLIICSKCGKKMIRRPIRNTKDYLICPTPYCSNIGSCLESVESRVIDSIKLWLTRYEIESNDNNTPKHNIKSNKDVIAQADRKIASLNNQLTNTYNLLEQGIYTKELFLKRQETLTNEINALQDRRKELLKEDEKTEQKNILRNQLIPQIRKLLDIYYDLSDAEKKNALLKKIFVKIIYTKEKGGRWDKKELDNFTLEFVSKLD